MGVNDLLCRFLVFYETGATEVGELSLADVFPFETGSVGTYFHEMDLVDAFVLDADMNPLINIFVKSRKLQKM